MSAPRLTLSFSEPLNGVTLAFRSGNESPTEWKRRARQAEDERKKAYRQGWDDGQKELSDQIIAQREELVNLQKGVFESLKNAVPQVVRDAEQTLASLALALAQKLVAEIPISPEMVEAAVKEAVAHLEEATEFHIYLHADDLALLHEIDSELLTPNTHPPHFHFHTGTRVDRGGCQVKTHFGILDASRETKAALLKEALLT